MRAALVIAGSAATGLIVWTPAPGMLNSMSCSPPVWLACWIAARSVHSGAPPTRPPVLAIPSLRSASPASPVEFTVWTMGTAPLLGSQNTPRMKVAPQRRTTPHTLVTDTSRRLIADSRPKTHALSAKTQIRVYVIQNAFR